MRLSPERRLLGLAGAFLLTNAFSLGLLNGFSLSLALLVAAWWLCAVVGQLSLERALPQRDPLLFPITLFLAGLGLLMILRLAPVFAPRQAIWLMIACLALILTASTPHLLRWLARYRYLLLLLGLLLLVSTILLGENPSGLSGAPELWLGFGSIFFQPAEALKIILVGFLASYLTEQAQIFHLTLPTDPMRRLRLRLVGPILLMWGICVVVLVWQRDLGTASIFFLVFVILLYVASGRLIVILLGSGLTTAALFLAYQLFAVVRLRVDIWINPWPEANDRAYQIVQSLMAFAAGGIGGQGVGQGLPGAIPVVHSDFIFAAIAEEWGLLGSLSVVLAFMVWVARGLKIASQQQNRPFQALLSVGLTSLIGVQSLLIMGGVLKIVPLTGVTLPFVSYGGSSLLVSFIIVGLLLRLSARREEL